MKNIIFIAPPAAGKGTQSTMLKESFGYNHLSTGDMLREVVSSGTDFGLQVKNIIDRGELVSDELILDGFPRTLNQAKSLDNMLDKDYEVIYLDLTEEEAIERILGRLTCSCGKSYNLNVDNLKPKVEGICDGCGKELVKRNDDNVDSFKVRYKTFLDNTKPLMEYYEDKNKLHKINVNRNVEDIFKDIVDVCND